MNILKNKKVSLILKTLGSVAGLASATVLLSPSFAQASINNANIKNDNLNRSTNEINRDALVNSEFYFKDFMFENPDKGEDVEGIVANIAAAQAQWTKIKTNLAKYNKFVSVPAYQYITQKITDLETWSRSDNFVVREALRVAGQLEVWNTIKESLGWQEFAEVAGTAEELSAQIKTLSGFVFGQSNSYRIRTLENKSAKTVDLLTGAETAINLTGEYKTVINIAEFDPTTLTEDIKIDFGYSSTTASAIAAQGSLIIRNKNGQLGTTDVNLANAQNGLEIFGRWTNLGNNSIGNNNFKAEMNNFVLSMTDTNKILVTARLKDGEQLTNIRVEGLDSFGIINSQIDTTPIFNSSNMTSNMKFFSTNLNMSNATSSEVPTSPNKSINKKYEFYIGNETEINLNLFYKNQTDGTYKELFAFEGDKVSATNKQTLTIGVIGGNATNLSTKNVEYSDEVIAELGFDNKDLSGLAFSLKTDKSSVETSSIFKQSLYLNDAMALAISGSPILAQSGITISLGNRITDKIFFEDPGFTAPATPAPTVSSSNAIKWVNSENQVITELAKIYEAWSKTDAQIGVEKLGQKFYNKIAFEKVGSTFKNITWRNESNDYTGRQMYQSIVDEYATYQQIVAQLIKTQAPIPKNIFEVGAGGTAQNIVKQTLLSIDNKAQRTIIIDNVKAIIDSDSQIKNLLIEKQLAELVRIKFSEMKTTLTDPINTFYYSQIKSYLDSEVTDKTKFAAVDSFLKFDATEGVFNLTSQNPKVLETQASLTGSQKMKSLFDVLYFGSKTYPSETTFFGNSIFSALSTNGGNESILDLFVGFNSNQDVLSNFSSSVSQTQIDSVNIYDRLLSIFGFGINSITENSLKTGDEIKLSWNGVNLDSAINIIFNKFNPTSVEKVNILEKNYEYNMFNSLITSSNIYNSLIFRKNNPPKGIISAEADQTKIRNILESGIISYKNIFTWSRIQKAGNDIDLYTTDFSKNITETIKFSNEIKTQIDILDRFIEEQNALFQINPFLNVQIVWPIIIGLVAVGMIVISSITLAGAQRTSKLSSKPVVKTMLIIAILISVAALGVIGGVVVPGLF